MLPPGVAVRRGNYELVVNHLNEIVLVPIGTDVKKKTK